jgi:hypothetical protein
VTKPTQAERIRALAADGTAKPLIAELLGCSRQAVAAALAVSPTRGRPRKPGKKRCPTCGHVLKS